MKGFFKFLGSVFTLFAGIIGFLAVLDALKNKNRIKGAYLDCSGEKSFTEDDE